jgi:guanylate kinase
MEKNNKYFQSAISGNGIQNIMQDKKSKKGLLFVVSGPSGVGKGTLREKLFKMFKDLTYSVSMTTRSPRKEEVNGIDYHFVSEAIFKQMIKENKFIEWAMVHGDYKGTPYEFLIERLKTGNDTLLEIDVQGAVQVKDKMPWGIYIFIAPPSWNDLEYRLRNRKTEEKKELEKRLGDARTEIKYVNNYDYLVINDNIETALKKLEAIIIAERCKIHKKEKYQ